MSNTTSRHTVRSALHWGIFDVKAQPDRSLALSPIEADCRPSPKLLATAKLVNSRDRLLYPMIRKGFLESGIHSRSYRGKDDFIRVSWDEALNLAATEINRVYDTYGPDAVFGRSYGWKSPGSVNNPVGLTRRLLNLCGGYVECVNTYSTAAISTILPYIVGMSDPPATTWDCILEHSSCIIFWGADPLVTNDVDWFTTLHDSSRYLELLRNSSIRTICINPLRPKTAEFLGSDWIAPYPGTDSALMLGLIDALDEQRLLQHDFIERYTSGWNKFEAYRSGQTDGIVKNVDWASEICGIAPEKIRSLARTMAQNRTMLMLGWGMQRAPHGEQPYWMGYALACALGQIGLPGGGIGTNYHYSDGGCPAARGPRLSGIGERLQPVRLPRKPRRFYSPIPVSSFADCFLHPGSSLDFNGRSVTYPAIKLVLWAGGNPFSHQPQTLKLRQAWQVPETVIVCDNMMTATAQHADIILPANTTFERDDITSIGAYTNRGICAMQQALPSAGESKSDFWIFSALADRLGVGSAFTEGKTEAQWIKHLYSQALAQAHYMGITLPSYEKFQENGLILYELDRQSRNFVAYADFRKDPINCPLNTESGLIQIYSEKIASYGYEDCPGHPCWFAPNVPDSRESLILVSPKSHLRLHSQLDRVSPACKDHGLEPVWMNPTDALSRGLADGQTVRVFNEYGSTVGALHLADDVRPRVVVIYHGAWFEPPIGKADTLDLGGCANVLTSDVPVSHLSCGNAASGFAVEVEAMDANLEPA